MDLHDYADAELAAAPKALTNHLFHYTSAEAAIFGVLSSGTLRLSPFESTNDLWESRPTYYQLSVHSDDEAVRGVQTFELWQLIDRRIRVNSKVACLTQDWELPDWVMDRDALRGWSHLSLWAHYGAAHAGVCLRFNRDALVAALTSSAREDARVFYGPVRYRAVSTGPVLHGIDIGQIREFGVDAVAIALAETRARSIFFEKHQDWASEAEYRIVRMDESTLPFEIDIASALTGVVLGEGFPEYRMPALREVLARYPHATLEQAHFLNRRLQCLPVMEGQGEDPTAAPRVAWQLPRRIGSLAERIAALRDAEAEARELHARGEVATEDVRRLIGEGIAGLSQELQAWSHIIVETLERSDAVPVHQRSRRPGVVGERVHYETGAMVVATDASDSAHVLVSSAAIQVLEGGVRLHAAVRTEDLQASPNHQCERWRVVREVPLTSADAVWEQVRVELRAATFAARDVFGAQRFRT